MCDKRWPIEHPDRIQLYSLATLNAKVCGFSDDETDGNR